MIGAAVQLDLSPADGLRKGGLRRALKIGLNRAASPVKAAVVAHAEAVRRFGYLAKSIRIRTRVYPADRFVAVIGPSVKVVRKRGKITRGPRAGQARVYKPSKYAHLVERGTSRSRPRPWLGPAHQETAARFLRSVGAEVGREIMNQLDRGASK